MPAAFAPTAGSRRRRITESLAGAVLLGMTLLLVLPLLAIIGFVAIHGAKAISFEFLFTEPTRGMTAGGIFPAIVGTLWLVGCSLAFTVPVGVLAAVYLN